MSLILKLANVDDPQSFSNRLRSRRFRMFESLAKALPSPLRILDVGGTNSFWEQRGWTGRDDVQISLLNQFPQKQLHSNIVPVTGDATDLRAYGKGSFDIVFSNSVIEHLFTLENQKRMAEEVRRVGKAIWVQTPNFWFPVEPHFHVLGWQWMPQEMRVSVLRKWKCGWRGPCKDAKQAREQVAEVRLMTSRELRGLFPGAELIPERIGGLVKSWIVVDGFAAKPTGTNSSG